MKQPTKALLAGGVLSLALIPASARFSPGEAGLFDPSNWTKAGLKAVFGKVLQRRLSIEGDLDVDFGQTLRIVAEDVAVENVEGASEPQMLHVDRLTVTLDLVELATGDITIPEVRLEQPTVIIERTQRGLLNWGEVLAGDVVDEPPAAGDGDAEGDGSGGIPTIGELIIENAEIRYIDPLADLDLTAQLERVSGTTGSESGGARLIGTGALAGLPLELRLEAGSLAAAPSGDPVPVELDLRLAASRVAVTGTAISLLELRGLDLRAQIDSEDPDQLLRIADRTHPELPPFALSGHLTQEGDAWRMAGLEARFGDSDLAGAAGVVLAGANPLIEADLHAQRLIYADFEPLVALFRGAPPDAAAPPPPQTALDEAALPRFDIALQADEVQGPDLVLRELNLEAVREQGAPTLDLATRGQFQGEPVAVMVRTGAGGGASDYRVEAEIEVARSNVDLSGTIDDPLALDGIDIRFAAAGAQPLALLRAAGLEVPDLPAVALSGRALRDDQTWQVADLALEVGASDLAGSVLVDLGGAAPELEADLAAEQIVYADLAKLLALAQAFGEDRAQPAPDELQLITFEGSNPQLNAAALPELEAEVTLTAQRIEAPQLELRDLRFTGGLHDQLPALQLQTTALHEGRSLQIEAALGHDGADRQNGRYPIEVRAEGEDTSLVLSGGIAEPIPLQGVELDFDLRSFDPEPWLALAGLADYDLKRVLTAGRLVQEDATWRLSDFYAEVGESNVFGEISADLAGTTPAISGELTSNRLIAADFMPQNDQPAVPLAEESAPTVAKPGLEPKVLPDIEADLSLEVEYLEAEQLRLDNLALALLLRDRVPIVDLTADGRLRREPVRLELHAGSQASFDDPERDYPVDLTLSGSETSVRAEGTIAQPLMLDRLDIDVQLKGPNLDRLGEIVQLALPATPPYRLAGNLTRDGRRWTLAGLDGRIGDSDIAGDATLDLGAERPTLIAELRSRKLDFDDLGPLVGAEPSSGPDETASERQERTAAIEGANRWLLPDDPIELAELRSMDARVTFTGEQVVAPNLPLERVAIDLTLEDGRLTLQPLEFVMADGELSAEIVLDARPKPLDSSFDVTVRNLKLNQFLSQFEVDIAQLEVEREGRGTLHGRARLESRGNTIHEMAAAADGQVTLLMDGGRVNALVLEAAGLDVGEVLALLIGGGPTPNMVPIECFIANFNVEQGVMRLRPLLLQAPDDVVVGSGTIDLGEERLDLTLESDPSDTSVLSAGTPIRIQGPWSAPAIEPVSDELIAKGAAALGLGIILPVVGAVIPFVELGEEGDSGCAAAVARAEARQ